MQRLKATLIEVRKENDVFATKHVEVEIAVAK